MADRYEDLYRALQPKKALYCPEEPSMRQKVFLKTNALEALYGGRAGVGKAIKGFFELPTPDGFKKVLDIHPGDKIFGRDGNVYEVLAESEVWELPGWKLIFDDGAEIEVNDDHLWLTFDYSERRQLQARTPEFREKRRAKRPSRAKEAPYHGKLQQQAVLKRNEHDNPAKKLIKPPPTGTVRTTKEIVETLFARGGSHKNHAVPVAAPIQLPHKDLSVDPYVLGAWLGDGLTDNGAICGADDEIFNEIQNHYSVKSASFRENNFRIERYNGLREDLKVAKVLGVKHIPHDYLWASEEQRLALLQGLMDTDGWVQSNGVKFTNTNKNLAEGVAHLARSLGMKATLREGRSRLNGEDKGPKWSVHFMPNRIVFRLPRKAQTQPIGTRQTNQFRYIVSAERTDPAPMKCLKVSAPDELFLVTEHFIPTHNSSALLMGALQYVDTPGYTALLFRRTFADLALPGALMDRFVGWIKEYDDEVRWNGNTFQATFPSGARIAFGYLNNVNDYLRYKGVEAQYVGMDEVTEIREHDYRYLFSRMRKPPSGPLSEVPIRMRSATNPAPNWVRQRFIVEGKEKGRIYVPATLADNPGVNFEEYARSLAQLDPVERARLEAGDWWAIEAGSMFKAEDFETITPEDLPRLVNPRLVRFWDMAATEQSEENPDPDWTVGLLMMENQGQFYVMDVRRVRYEGKQLEDYIKLTAQEDGPHVAIRMEQEPGSAGKNLGDYYARSLLVGYDYDYGRVTGDKATKARPVASAVRHGNVKLLSGPWISDFKEEVVSFPENETAHDDQVDALAGAFNDLTGLGKKLKKKIRIIV